MSFINFWNMYPRKVAKKAAEKAWDKAVKDADPEDILKGLENWLKHAKPDEKFTPHCATWLNQGRWEDELFKPSIHTKPAGSKIMNRREQSNYCDERVPQLIRDSFTDLHRRRPDWKHYWRARGIIENRAHYAAQLEWLQADGWITLRQLETRLKEDIDAQWILTDADLDGILQSEASLSLRGPARMHWEQPWQAGQ